MKQTLVDGEHIRALAILAENPDGYTRAIMLARGFLACSDRQPNSRRARDRPDAPSTRPRAGGTRAHHRRGTQCAP
jgi:hypothetical protein